MDYDKVYSKYLDNGFSPEEASSEAKRICANSQRVKLMSSRERIKHCISKPREN